MPKQQPLVLIANDDDAMRDALQFSLQLENFEVRVHRCSADLLADCELRRADCLILKDHMPDMGGLDLVRCLRAHNIRLPTILLTANATPGLQRRAAEAGIWLVLENPILDNALLEGVAAILDHGGAPGDRAAT